MAVRLPVLLPVITKLEPLGACKPALFEPLFMVLVPLRVRFAVAPIISKATALGVPLTSILTFSRILSVVTPLCAVIRLVAEVPLDYDGMFTSSLAATAVLMSSAYHGKR
jgi:hypothetical protein